ncbi:hypothetical protein P5673_011259 [Acropora cervicornis]|uniref:Uncharacterized protein n=1 Tax=Acropora cervicornis TaxID=6130 RepID=A0AAD9QQ54_ACRCE|nr:hypothetical protein P5673_011259 [Acropora cervicornis]
MTLLPGSFWRSTRLVVTLDICQTLANIDVRDSFPHTHTVSSGRVIAGYEYTIQIDEYCLGADGGWQEDGSYETATMMSSLKKWFSHCLVRFTEKEFVAISEQMN